MIDYGKRNILGVLVDAVDYDTASTRVIAAAKDRISFSLTALAVHGVMTGVLDPTHRYRLNHLDMVVPDGQPVRWGINWLYRCGLPDRVYGPNLMLKVCTQAAKEDLPIYLYGSRQETLAALSQNLQAKFPKLTIAGMSPSLFRKISPEEKLDIVSKIIDSGAKIVFVGLGCPRQEVWVFEHMEHLPMPMLAVGAAFDFHAGLLSQAPKWFQDHGLEWFYRLYREPARLWKRYIFLNPLYIILLFIQKMGIRQFNPNKNNIPTLEVRFG